MYNNLVDKSRKFGSVIPITNGINWDIMQVGFNIDINMVPDVNNGHLPAGMLLICDEATHSAVPFKIAQVVSVSSKNITIASNGDFCPAPFVVGESIMKMGADFTTAGTAQTISAIVTDADKTVITTSTALSVAAGDYIILCKADGNQYGAPNAMLPFDAYKETGAFAITVPAARSIDGDVFENRIPVIPDLAKTALINAGCRFGFSQSV